MSLKRFLPIFSLSLLFLTTKAQNDSIDFKPSGKVIAVSYFDYSTGLNSHSNESGFDLTRALLGYKYKFHPKLEATVTIDGAAGRSTDNELKVHVRNAFVSWTEGKFKLNLGLTNLKQFNTQQSAWGHRYALRSQQDLSGMGHAVDIGAVVSYDFCSFFSADFSVTNGEGYKKIRKDKSMRYSLGMTFHPLKNFTLRAYADIYTSDKDRFNEQEIGESIKNQYTYSFFAGYEDSLLSIGVELNKQLHSDYVRGNHLLGISAYSTVNINSKWNVYARYDYLDSSNYIANQANWYDDYQIIMAGIEYKPLKFLRFSPSFRNYNYDQDSSEQYIFISGEFSF